VHEVANLKQVYTMMHGQKNVKFLESWSMKLMNNAISQYSDVFVECTEITVPFLSFISALGFISNIFPTRIFIVWDNFDSGSLTHRICRKAFPSQVFPNS